MRLPLAALILSLAAQAHAAPSHLAPIRPGYVLDAERTCDGYPRLPIETLKGVCAGFVLGPPAEGQRPSQRVLHLPRMLLPLKDGDFLVTDLGAWTPGQGSVWRLSPRPSQAPVLKKLLTGLDMPHTIAIGPDGGVYVGEMSRIIRFDPDAPDPAATTRAVVTGLPANRLHDDRHPLSSFIFDGDNALLIDVGAPSDQCAPPPVGPKPVCAEAEGVLPTAAIWRFAYLGEGRWGATPTLFARGLRNSMALVRHPSGALFQGENSIDIDDPDNPYDSINRLNPGANYGWPYCINAADPAPAWRGAGPLDCKGPDRTRPILLLPPHGAPLAMLYYHGAMFPKLEGRLLVSLHGYRSTGARIIAYAVDASGAPLASPKAGYAARRGGARIRRRFREGPAADGLSLTPGWDATPGLRPAGAPVGLAIAADGALWVADDRNGTILRFAKDTAAGR
jgi:glucose/arabinose dehydrogenase